MSVSTAAEPPARVRPFLKWAGGKRQLLRELRRFMPSSFGAYHEPFLGSGAVFFDLWREGALAGRTCRLTDINPDLVGVYQAVSSNVDEVIRELRVLAAGHLRLGKDAYYQVRDEAFNPRRRELMTKTSAAETYPADLAAMFIYLNRTGYNGLFRLNGRGDFNVPAGRYPNPRICDMNTLRSVAQVLGQPTVSLCHDSYASVTTHAMRGDLIYLDPPYAPISPTARFTSYTSASFSEDDQARLQELAIALAGRGCHVILSNSTAPLVTALYGAPEARAVGLRAHRVSARRAINSKASSRGQVDEYIISNRTPVP